MGADNPLNDYAKKSYVDDKIKNIDGGKLDLSAYTKQTDFVAYKDKMQKDLGNYATGNALMTLRHNLEKDVKNLKNSLAVRMGKDYFNGIDGMLNTHIYPPDLRRLKFHTEGGGKVEEWVSVGINPKSITSRGFKLAPNINTNSDLFEMQFGGHILHYGKVSKYNAGVTNVYIVYRLNKYKTQNIPKYPIVNALFGAVRIDTKLGTDYKKWLYHGKGIAIG